MPEAQHDPALVYLGAIEKLETMGWCQGDYIDPDGRVCMAAAVALAADDDQPYPTRECLRELIIRHAKEHGIACPTDQWTTENFNDRPDTTLEDVKELLRMAYEESRTT